MDSAEHGDIIVNKKPAGAGITDRSKESVVYDVRHYNVIILPPK